MIVSILNLVKMKSFILGFYFCICFLSVAQAQWTSIGPGGQSLSFISFFDATYGWTCGSGGSIFKTIIYLGNAGTKENSATRGR